MFIIPFYIIHYNSIKSKNFSEKDLTFLGKRDKIFFVSG